MAYGLPTQEVDPLSFSLEDEYQGARLEKDPKGLIRTVDQTGAQRWRRKGRMAGGIRDKLLMAQMKSGMAALWADGQTYAQIAEQISDYYNLEGDERISAHGIQYHIKTMLDYWRQKGLAKMDERQAVILARFDQLEALALEAYFASMEGKKTTHKNKQIEKARSKDRLKKMSRAEKEKREEEGKKAPMFIDTGTLLDLDNLVEVGRKIQKNTRFEESRAGDSKFLNLVFSINRERAKILGLYNRKDHGTADDEAAKLTDTQRQQRLATLFSAAKSRRALSTNQTMLAEPAPLGGFQEETPLEKAVPDIELPDDDEGWGFDEDSVELPSQPEVEWD